MVDKQEKLRQYKQRLDKAEEGEDPAPPPIEEDNGDDEDNGAEEKAFDEEEDEEDNGNGELESKESAHDAPEAEDEEDSLLTDEPPARSQTAEQTAKQREQTIDKALKAIEKQSSQISELKKENHQLREALQKDEPYPEMDTEFPDGQEEEAMNFNPYDQDARQGDDTDEGDKNPSSESTTEPGTDWSEVADDHIPKSKVDEYVEKKLEQQLGNQLDEKVDEAVKNRTPTPYNYAETEEARLARENPAKFVNKAIEHDRKACGGAFNTNEGRFGFKTGEGNDRARIATANYIRKALGRDEAQFLNKGGGF